jgi:hypothetical protein
MQPVVVSHCAAGSTEDITLEQKPSLNLLRQQPSRHHALQQVAIV